MSVPLNFAEIMSSLTSGGTEVKSAILVPPFTQYLLETGKVRVLGDGLSAIGDRWAAIIYFEF